MVAIIITSVWLLYKLYWTCPKMTLIQFFAPESFFPFINLPDIFLFELLGTLLSLIHERERNARDCVGSEISDFLEFWSSFFIFHEYILIICKEAVCGKGSSIIQMIHGLKRAETLV